MKYYFCINKVVAKTYIKESNVWKDKYVIIDLRFKKEYHAVDYIKNVAVENKGYLLYSIDIDLKCIDDKIYVKYLWPDTSDDNTTWYKIILYNDLNKLLDKNGIKSENKEEKKETYYIDLPRDFEINYTFKKDNCRYIIIRNVLNNNLEYIKLVQFECYKEKSNVYKIEVPFNIKLNIAGDNTIVIYDDIEDKIWTLSVHSIKIFKNRENLVNDKVPRTKSLKSLYPYTEHWLDEYIKERPEFPPINTHVKYNENEVKFAYDLYKEKTMTIKDIKINGPATIVFWNDNTKTIVKCQKADNYDPEKGIVMALVKGIFQKYKGTNNWTEAFKIPYSDEIDVEKVIGLALLSDHYGHVLKDPEWHYNYVLKYLYKHKGYKLEDEIRALKGLGYSDERIKKCLKTNFGVIRDALKINKVEKPEKPPVLPDMFTDESQTKEMKWLEEKPKEVTEEEPTELSKADKILDMFNKGYSISKISKLTGITEYYVKKYLDAATNPKYGKNKAARILNNITKKKKNKTEKRTYERRTEIEYPNYLDKETCERLLEFTKEKYKDNRRINCLSELQKYYDRECKREYIITHYGNGYDMYTIANIIGTSAAAVQRMWNQYKSEKED